MKFTLSLEEPVRVSVSVQDCIVMNIQAGQRGYVTHHGGYYLLGGYEVIEGHMVAVIYPIDVAQVPNTDTDSGEEA